MEAITSRPLLLAAAGRATHSGGQTTLYLAPLHGKAKLLKPLIANIHAALQHVKAAAEQFKTADPWAVLLRYVSDKIAPMPRAVQATNRAVGDGVTAGFRFTGGRRQFHRGGVAPPGDTILPSKGSGWAGLGQAPRQAPKNQFQNRLASTARLCNGSRSVLTSSVRIDPLN
jgi:hypothetical protein